MKVGDSKFDNLVLRAVTIRFYDDDNIVMDCRCSLQIDNFDVVQYQFNGGLSDPEVAKSLDELKDGIEKLAASMLFSDVEAAQVEPEPDGLPEFVAKEEEDVV